MPVKCETCPDHGALVAEINHLKEDLKDRRETMKNLTVTVAQLKEEILKLNTHEKIWVAGISAIAVVFSGVGSIIGTLLVAYLKLN